MNDDTFQRQLRRFLKKVGITSQGEIENAVRAALANRSLAGDETLQASVILRVPALGLEVEICDEIHLG